MPEEKPQSPEYINELEVEMKSKMAELQKILGQIQAESAKSPEEIITKAGDAKDVQAVADAIKQMQKDVGEKRQAVETAIKDVQAQMDQLRALRERAQKEDVAADIKSLLLNIREKKESLETAVKDVEELRAEYTKKFYG